VQVKTTDLAAFDRAAEASYKVIRGKVVPAEAFDEVKRLVAESKGKK
jgi:hypothetical protein